QLLARLALMDERIDLGQQYFGNLRRIARQQYHASFRPLDLQTLHELRAIDVVEWKVEDDSVEAIFLQVFHGSARRLCAGNFEAGCVEHATTRFEFMFLVVDIEDTFARLGTDFNAL